MGHLVQMAGLAVQNFVSAAVGMAVAVALVRGFARHRTDRTRQLLGRPGARHAAHPAADRRRSPRSSLIAGGAIQNFHLHDQVVNTLAGGQQTITGGPVASQEAIKELGTNGGGFYNANSAHPFENPTAVDELGRDLPAAGRSASRCRAPSAAWSDSKKQGYAIARGDGRRWR